MVVVSKREVTRQYIEARDSGRKQARKRRSAEQNAPEKLGLSPNPPIAQQLPWALGPSKKPSVPRNRNTRSEEQSTPSNQHDVSRSPKQDLSATKSPWIRKGCLHTLMSNGMPGALRGQADVDRLRKWTKMALEVRMGVIDSS